jgi:hypothetical protein
MPFLLVGVGDRIIDARVALNGELERMVGDALRLVADDLTT